MPTIADQSQQLIDAGMDPVKAGAWRADKLRTLQDAGASREQVDTQAGMPPIVPKADMSAVQTHIKNNFDALAAENAKEDAAAEEATKVQKPATDVTVNPGGAPDATTDTVAVTATRPSPADSLWDLFLTGIYGSGLGMASRQKMPPPTPDDMDIAQRLMYNMGGFIGDLPVAIGGGVVGALATSETVVGVPVGAAAGFMAAPAALRAGYVNQFKTGEPVTAKDYAIKVASTLWKAVEAGVKGGATGATAAIGGGVAAAGVKAAGGSVTLQLAANLPTQVAVATAMSKLVEGQLPEGKDFLDNYVMMALTVFGAHVVSRGVQAARAARAGQTDQAGQAGQTDQAGQTEQTAQSEQAAQADQAAQDKQSERGSHTMADIFAATGIRPDAVVVLAENDPTIAQDIMNGHFPKSLEPLVTTDYATLEKSLTPDVKPEPNIGAIHDIHPAEAGPALDALTSLDAAKQKADQLKERLDEQAGKGPREPRLVAAFMAAREDVKAWEKAYDEAVDSANHIEIGPVAEVGAATMASQHTLKTGEQITITPSIRGMSQLNNPDPGANPNISAVARLPDGTIVGHVYMENMGDGVLKPNFIETKEAWRRKGVGTALYQHFVDQGFKIELGRTQTESGNGFRAQVGIMGEANADKAQAFINGIRNEEYAPSSEDSAGGSGGATPPGGNSGKGTPPPPPENPPVPPSPPEPPPELPPISPEKAIESKISFAGSDPEAPYSWHSQYTRFLDDLHPLKMAQDEMGLSGAPMTQRFYELMRLTRGNAGRAQQQLHNATFDPVTRQNNGESLSDVLAGVQNDVRGIAVYAVAKRALEKNAQGIDTGIPTYQAEAAVALGADPYDYVFRRLVDYNNRITKNNLVNTGVLSESVWENDILPKNKDFVPYYRVLDGNEGGLGFGGRVRNPIREMKGSDRDIINPLESIVKNTFLWTNIGELNLAVGAFLDGAAGTGHPEQWAIKVPPAVRSVELNSGEIQKIFDNFLTTNKKTSTSSTTETTTTGGEGNSADVFPKNTARVMEALTARGFSENEANTMVRRLQMSETKGGESVTSLVKEVTETEYVPEINTRVPTELATVFRAIRQPLTDSQVGYFRNGEYEVYEVGKGMASAFRDLNNKESGFLVKVLEPFASSLRAGATLTTQFMGSNLVRDATSSFIQQPIGKSIPFLDQLLGGFATASKSEDFQNFLKGGGSNSALVAMDRDYMRIELGKLGLKGLDNETGVLRRGWNVMTTPFDYMRAASELIDNITRVGNARRAPGEPEGPGRSLSADQVLEAGFAGRTGSLDFQRKGSDNTLNALNKIAAFSRTSVQGADQMVRQFIPAEDQPYKPLETAALVAIGVVLPTILLYEANKDDPRYADISHGMRNTKHIIMTEDHIFMSPKPFNEGVLYGGGTEQVLKAYDNWRAGRPQDTVDQAHFAKDVASAIGGSFIPNGLLPGIEQWANYNFYQGNKLVPDAKGKFPAEYQYNDYTTETMKKVGSLIGQFPGMNPQSPFMPNGINELQAPIILDNYVREWTGGMGQQVMDLLDYAARKAGVVPDPVKATDTLADIPVVKAFVLRYPSMQAQSITDFYETEARHEKFFNAMQMLAKSGDSAGLNHLLKISPGKEDQLSPVLDQIVKLPGISTSIGNMNKAIHLVNINPGMSDSDKRQAIDQMYMQAIFSAHAGNDMFKAIDSAIENLSQPIAK